MPFRDPLHGALLPGIDPGTARSTRGSVAGDPEKVGASPDGSRVTGYSGGHEKPPICCSRTFGGRARGVGGGPTLLRGFCIAPLTDPSFQLPRRARTTNSPEPGMRLPDGGATQSTISTGMAREGPEPGPSRPEHTRAAFAGEGAEALREMLHRSPREFGKGGSSWTLGFETRPGGAGSCSPRCTPGSRREIRCASSNSRPPKTIPIRKRWRLTGCRCARRKPTGGIRARAWLRFVDGRPVSAVTTRFLEWICERLEDTGKKASLLVWDDASRHKSREVRSWIGYHNGEVRKSGRVGCAYCPAFCCLRRARSSTP